MICIIVRALFQQEEEDRGEQRDKSGKATHGGPAIGKLICDCKEHS